MALQTIFRELLNPKDYIVAERKLPSQWEGLGEGKITT
jgi:hypothetical protein